MTEVSSTHNTMTTTNEMENMYLNFSLCNETYGIEVQYVIQIVGMQDITEMPEMSPAMKGFINLRGTVIPVVSMREKFSMPETANTDRTCIIVVRVEEKEVGLIVDTIQETTTIEPECVSPPPSTGATSCGAYISGVARLESDLTAILLDVQKLFAKLG